MTISLEKQTIDKNRHTKCSSNFSIHTQPVIKIIKNL